MNELVPMSIKGLMLDPVSNSQGSYFEQLTTFASWTLQVPGRYPANTHHSKSLKLQR
jgi:hypothetical protein